MLKSRYGNYLNLSNIPGLLYIVPNILILPEFVEFLCCVKSCWLSETSALYACSICRVCVSLIPWFNPMFHSFSKCFISFRLFEIKLFNASKFGKVKKWISEIVKTLLVQVLWCTFSEGRNRKLFVTCRDSENNVLTL